MSQYPAPCQLRDVENEICIINRGFGRIHVLRRHLSGLNAKFGDCDF